MAKMTVYLTKVMNRESELQRLVRSASRLAPVSDYYRGKAHGRSPDGTLPDNVLMFVRGTSPRLPVPSVFRDFHRRFVLIVSLAGEGHVEIDARPIRLRPGNCVLIQPFQFHSYPQVPSGRYCWVYITFERSQPERKEDWPAGARLGDEMIPLLGLLLRQWQSSGDPAGTGWTMALGLATMLELLRDTPHRAIAAPAEQAPSWAAQLIDAIRSPQPRPMRIEELAERVGWSPSHLRAEFRRRFGVSLGRYLRNYRMNRARTLVIHANFSLRRVAMACGFESVYSFSRAFTQTFGAPPIRYRKQVQGK